MQMAQSKELFEEPQTAMVPVKPATLSPMEMIQAAYQSAIEHGAGLEVVNSIVAQMREERDYRDREEFNAALRRIQNSLKPIAKRGENPQTHSKFGKAEDIDAQLEPLLQAEGMTLSFEPEPTGVPDMMRLIGVLSLGAYSRRYPLDMPCDGQGPKGGGVMSRTHATGSGVTLCKRYLKNAIFNLRFKDDDDDGNKAGGGGKLDEKVNLEHLENLRNAGSKAELNRLYVIAIKAASAAKDLGSLAEFEAAAQKRSAELS
jgi:hypothetical protein